MKINLKNKIMLAILAGNMLCMSSAWADTNIWYGNGDYATNWWGEYSYFSSGSCTTGANLTLSGTESAFGEYLPFDYVHYFLGGCSDSNVTHNTITVTGGSFEQDGCIIAGAYATEIADAINNSIIILDGTFGGGFYFSGGLSSCSLGGASSHSGTVSSNTVKISGGTFGNSNNFYGGLMDVGGSGDVTNNTVTISSGTFGKLSKFYGGYSNGGDATNNIVTIESGSFGSNCSFYGGYSTINSTGNIFNLKTRLSGLKEVAYFQKINFTLPSDVANGDTIVSVGKFYVDTKGGRVEFTVSASDSISLKKGDIITLIDSADTNNSDVYVDNDSVLDGTAKVYRENGESKNSDGDTNDIILEMLDDLIILEPEVPTSDFLASSDISNIAEAADGKLQEFIDNVSETFGDDTKMATNAVNTMANMAQLANVQHGAYSIGNLAMDETFNHMSVQNRSLEYSGTPKYKLRNTAMDGDTYKMNTIPVGRVRDVLPSRTVGRVIAEDNKYNRYDREDNYYREYRRNDNYYTPSHRSYSIPKHSYQYTTAIEEPDKMIWATYIHSKEKINGMQVGHLKQDSTIKQNGAVVGADLWKNDNNFGGIAITYAKGDVNSTQQVSNVKNDVDHYGASIYHRQDMSKFSVQLDAGYGKSNNDIKMETIGAENVTLKPKTEAYSAGIKIEEPLELNDKTLLVPFLGLRYTFMKTKKADSNLDITYGGNEQNMCSIPVGLSLRSQYEVSDSMKLGTTLEAGYAFNVGDRKGTQKLLYGGVTDSISYNIVDKGQYFIKAAIQAICENMIWELGYHYAKSSKVKDDKWYVNANFDF